MEISGSSERTIQRWKGVTLKDFGYLENQRSFVNLPRIRDLIQLAI